MVLQIPECRLVGLEKRNRPMKKRNAGIILAVIACALVLLIYTAFV